MELGKRSEHIGGCLHNHDVVHDTSWGRGQQRHSHDCP